MTHPKQEEKEKERDGVEGELYYIFVSRDLEDRGMEWEGRTRARPRVMGLMDVRPVLMARYAEYPIRP